MSNATPVRPEATDHLAKARDYIAIAESQDSKREAYMKAADEIIAAQKDDPTLGQREIGQRLGKAQSWVSDLVRWRTSDSARDSLPFQRDDKDTHEIRQQRDAEKVLADPEQRRQVIASLPADVREAVIEESHEAAVADVRAKQAEHDTTPRRPTAGDLMGGDRFDPSESWADTDIIRVQSKAHALARQVAKWGLVLGSLSEDEAFQMLQEAEQNIAEVRAALQERIADRTGV